MKRDYKILYTMSQGIAIAIYDLKNFTKDYTIVYRNGANLCSIIKAMGFKELRRSCKHLSGVQHLDDNVPYDDIIVRDAINTCENIRKNNDQNRTCIMYKLERKFGWTYDCTKAFDILFTIQTPNDLYTFLNCYKKSDGLYLGVNYDAFGSKKNVEVLEHLEPKQTYFKTEE